MNRETFRKGSGPYVAVIGISAAVLGSIGSCIYQSLIDNQPVMSEVAVISQNRPTKVLYVRGQDDENDVQVGDNYVWAWDVDGDGIVDEAVKASDYFAGALQSIPSDPPKGTKLEHLVAPGTDPAKLYFTQPSAQDMGTGERASLTAVYGMVNAPK